MSDHKKKTPHQRIMIAAAKGVGIRLSADEVFRLSIDDAIATRAGNDDLNDEGVPDREAAYQAMRSALIKVAAGYGEPISADIAVEALAAVEGKQ